jgi:chromosome segregation ATPase
MGVNAVVARRFRRSDGVVGVGFYVEHAGLRMASVAWPDREAQRYTDDHFQLKALEDEGEMKSILSAAEQEISAMESEVQELSEALSRFIEENHAKAQEIEEKDSLIESMQEKIIGLEAAIAMAELSASDIEEIMNSEELASSEAPAEPSLVEPSAPLAPVASSEPFKSEAQHIRDYIAANPEASNSQVIEHLATISVNVTSSQIASQRRRAAKS